MNAWTWFVLYLKALRPSALAASLKKREADAYRRGWDTGFDRAAREEVEAARRDAYRRGWDTGFDKGHRRGWIELRAKIGKANKYPHEPAKDRS